jgi:hypothetical protein
MLDRLFLSSGGAPEYIGSVTAEYGRGDKWDADEPLDVLSIAQTGDLVVIAFSFEDSAESIWSWVGMNFTQILNATNNENPGAYVGYRFVQSGDANPYVSGVGENWDELSVVASVFRGVSSFSSGSSSNDSSGMPDPPSLTTTGALWVITGHVIGSLITNWGAPANYTLADFQNSGVGAEDYSSTAIAYRIETLSSDNPGAFTGSGNGQWRATTSAYL